MFLCLSPSERDRSFLPSEPGACSISRMTRRSPFFVDVTVHGERYTSVVRSSHVRRGIIKKLCYTILQNFYSNETYWRENAILAEY